MSKNKKNKIIMLHYYNQNKTKYGLGIPQQFKKEKVNSAKVMKLKRISLLFMEQF